MFSYFKRSDDETEERNGSLQISRSVSTIFSHRANDVPASGLILTLANTRMTLIAVSSIVPEDPKSTLSSSLDCLSFSSSSDIDSSLRFSSPTPLDEKILVPRKIRYLSFDLRRVPDLEIKNQYQNRKNGYRSLRQLLFPFAPFP